MKIPQFENFVGDAGNFFSHLGIVFHSSTEDRLFCESIEEDDALFFLGHVGDQYNLQQSLNSMGTIKKTKIGKATLLFGVSLGRGRIVDRSLLTLYIDHIKNVFVNYPVIVLFYYETNHNLKKQYITLVTAEEQNSEQMQIAMISHIHISSPLPGHILALEYIQKKIRKASIKSYDTFHDCWHELFFQRGVLNHITKNISDEIQEWYTWSLKWIHSDNDNIVHTQDIQMFVHRFLICVLTCWHIREGQGFKDVEFLRNVDLFRNVKFFWKFVEQSIPPLYSILSCDEIPEDILFSDVLFFGDAEHSGLIDILQSYPFTTRENTMCEQEVSLNPEFLGHVYENILTIQRKHTGSFYTSQDLVRYMIDEAIVGYFRIQLLKRKYDVEFWTQEKIRPFVIDDKKIAFRDVEREMLLDWILSCKIIDPSCGCGSFVVGILQKIQSMVKYLDPDFSIAQRLSVKRELSDKKYGSLLFPVQNCMYGIDIQSLAVNITKIRCALLMGQHYEHHNIANWLHMEDHLLTGNALCMSDLQKQFFDIVIGNPPYVGHKGGQKEFFREIKKIQLGKKYNQERMDLFYYFFHLGIEIAKQTGIICFLTTNYYPTVDSAVKLRKHIKEETIPFLFVDFNEYELFSSALGQHNLMTFLCKTRIYPSIKIVNFTKRKGDSHPSIRYILRHETSEVHTWKCTNNQYVDTKTGFFLLKEQNPYIDMLQQSSEQLKDLFYVSQGMVTGADKVKRKHVLTNACYQKCLGEGIFVVSNSFFAKLPKKEQGLLKRWFKNSDITKYSLAEEKLTSYVIQLTADTNLSNYPTIQKHLLKYKKIILGRNYESGELKKAKKKGSWWALSSSRKDFDFSQPKILIPYRQKENIIGYTKEEYCASADVFFVTKKESNRHVSLEVLLLLLNSRILFLYLYTKGRRKGELLELYKTPLEAIPIPKLSEEEHLVFDRLSKSIIALEGEKCNTTFLQKVGDFLILEHYFSKKTTDSLDILSAVHQDLEWVFEKIDTESQMETLRMITDRWEDTNSPIAQSINHFTKKYAHLCTSILSIGQSGIE